MIADERIQKKGERTMTDRNVPPDEPCYVISVAAKMVDLHPQTLRYYDKIGLLEPSRTKGRIRMYSPRDIWRLRKITRLTDDLGVNLAGVDVILNMTKRIEQLQRELERVREEAAAEIEALNERVRELTERGAEKGENYQVISVRAREIDDVPEEGGHDKG